MTEMSELNDKYFKAAVIKMLRLSVTNMLEMDEKIQNPDKETEIFSK